MIRLLAEKKGERGGKEKDPCFRRRINEVSQAPDRKGRKKKKRDKPRKAGLRA